jgi:hypothetical protein
MIANFKLACPSLVIPFFHLSPCSPTQQEDSSQDFNSHKLAIHVDRNKNQKLELLLSEEYIQWPRQKKHYVPWNMKQSSHDGYGDAMFAQSTYDTNCWVVPVCGITKEQMLLLCPCLLAESCIDSVERTKYTSVNRHWDVLCKKIFFRTTQATVCRVLKGFDSLEPTSQSKLPPGWKKWSESHHDEDSSKGTLSFMTTSARSFASIVTN